MHHERYIICGKIVGNQNICKYKANPIMKKLSADSLLNQFHLCMH